MGQSLLAVLRRPAVSRVLAAAFSIGIFTLALWVLSRTVGRFDVDDVLATARAYPAWVLVAGLLLSMASYLALSGFDILGLFYMKKRVPLGSAALVSFVSHSISHNAGFAVLTGGSVRLRMYTAFGLGVGEVAGVIAFAGLTFALGAASLGAFAFITEGDKVANLLRLPPAMVTGIGWLVAGGVVAYAGWTAVMRRPVTLGRWRMETPTLAMSLAQIGVAALDLALVAGTLYLLLPLETVSYPAFVGLYVVATLAGTLSHVPGGLGVFEGALVLLLPEIEPSGLLAALLVFRVFYNLLPLLIGAVVLAVFEIVQRRRHAEGPAWLRLLGPPLGALAAFGAGLVLLLTGAAPSPAVLPRPIAEPAHLLGAASGAALLALAWGLFRQVEWAWRAAVAAALAGALAALLRGPDWTTAAVAAAAAAVLSAAGPLFHGRGDARLPVEWLGAAAAVVAGAFWLTGHADPQSLRLLDFATTHEGARAMRGNVIAAAALLAAALAGRIVKAP